jgi:hypothetical protein
VRRPGPVKQSSDSDQVADGLSRKGAGHLPKAPPSGRGVNGRRTLLVRTPICGFRRRPVYRLRDPAPVLYAPAIEA